MSRKPQAPTFSWDPSNRRSIAASNRNDTLHRNLLEPCSDSPISNGLELRSIQALISYIAYERSVNEEVIRTLVKDRFGFDGTNIKRDEVFEEIIRFLVDLNIRENLN